MDYLKVSRDWGGRVRGLFQGILAFRKRNLSVRMVGVPAEIRIMPRTQVSSLPVTVPRHLVAQRATACVVSVLAVHSYKYFDSWKIM